MVVDSFCATSGDPASAAQHAYQTFAMKQHALSM
jgi:hypothetical protein